MEEATWETDLGMQTRYANFFDPLGTSFSLTFEDKSPFSSGCCNGPHGDFIVFACFYYFILFVSFVCYWVGLHAFKVVTRVFS